MTTFPGPDYVEARDHARLASQLERIRLYMLGHGEFRTLDQIAEATHSPHASVSAQLRHLATPKFGGYVKNRIHLGNGLYGYQILPPIPPTQTELFSIGGHAG